MSDRPPYYSDYLELDTLLECQRPITDAEEEGFFIVVHQVYELWFKQILHELSGVLDIFGADRPASERRVEERRVARAVSHLERVHAIQRLLIGQIDVLQTMTPMDFLEFRDNLRPASGFQSLQFRLIEIALGVRREQRVSFGRTLYRSALEKKERSRLDAAESRPSLFDLVESWLERMPFLETESYDFWRAYRDAVTGMLSARRERSQDAEIPANEQEARKAAVAAIEERFDRLFGNDDSEAEESPGRMSQHAQRAALMINLYRQEPILYQPFRVLSILIDIDEAFATWRHRHALMAARMIGLKEGTGQSSGYQYLRESVERSKVFNDLVYLATFYIPTRYLPELPAALRRQLGFWLSSEDRPA